MLNSLYDACYHLQIGDTKLKSSHRTDMLLSQAILDGSIQNLLNHNLYILDYPLTAEITILLVRAFVTAELIFYTINLEKCGYNTSHRWNFQFQILDLDSP